MMEKSSRSGNWKYRRRRLLALVLTVSALLSVLSGCGSPSQAAETTLPEETAPVVTAPPDGNPADITAKGNYTDEKADGSRVIATVGQEELTIGQLNVLYQLVINGLPQDGERPDFALPLELQTCGLSSQGLTWQQYFLQQALELWHTLQGLQQKSLEYVKYEEEYFAPDKAKHDEYMTGMPILPIMLTEDGSFKLNSMEREILEKTPEQLKTLAKNLGYESVQALVEGELPAGVTGEDLETVTYLLNYAYFYFLSQTYDLEFSDQEIQRAMGHVEDPEEELVTIRHILLQPENATVDAEGRVTASQEDWEQVQILAEDSLKFFQTPNPQRYTVADEAEFAQSAHDHSKDAGTQKTGGLYEHLRKGQLVEPLNSWAFDPAREEGDMEIVKSDFGVHLMYFCSREDAETLLAKQWLRREHLEQVMTQMRKDYPLEVTYGDIRLYPVVGRGKLTAAEHLLYPDVAHERFSEVPVYLQQDYMDAPYNQGYKVGTHGCGISAFAMLSSYMTDTLMTPGSCAKEYSAYGGVAGTDGRIFVQVPPKLGYFLIKRTGYMDDVEQALKTGGIAVTIQQKGYFTRGGHYLVLSQWTDDDKIVIRDSNIYNYMRLKEHKQDKFPPNSLLGSYASFWVYDNKVVRTPVCARCGDLPGPKLLTEDYLCTRCRTALERRGNFIDLCQLP